MRTERAVREGRMAEIAKGRKVGRGERERNEEWSSLASLPVYLPVLIRFARRASSHSAEV